MDVPWYILPKRYQRFCAQAWQADAYYAVWQMWAQEYLMRSYCRRRIPPERRTLKRLLEADGVTPAEQHRIAARIRHHAVNDMRTRLGHREQPAREPSPDDLPAVPGQRPAMVVPQS